MASNQLDIVLELLDRSFDRQSWHGPNLRGSVRGVDVTTAAWRPGPGRRNIWEHVVHAAYWKYTVRRRLLGEKRGSFPLEGSNWFVRPQQATPAAWRADIALLEQTHKSLRAAVAKLRPEDLTARVKKSKVTTLMLIGGIAAHDVYHAGQIQLIKRLARQG